MSSQKDFYVVLPSNVELKSGESNTPSDYATELGIPIELESDSDMWEVGLVEMSFVNSLKTIDKEGILVKLAQTKIVSHYYLYKFLPEIAANIVQISVAGYRFDTIEISHGSILNLGSAFFKYDRNESRFTLNSSSNEFYKYTIDNTLASLMGYHPQVHNADWITRVLYTPTYVKHWAHPIESSTKLWKAPHAPSVHIEGGKHYLVLAPSNIGIDNMFPTNKPIEEKKVTVPTEINLHYIIPPGCYRTPKQLATAINQTGLVKQAKISISFDVNFNRFLWNVLNQNVTLFHTNHLESILGFEEREISKSVMAKYPPRLQLGIDNLQVHCDVCSEMFVGNTLKPLLRSINMPISRMGESINVLFNNPIYVPCVKHSIDTIRIQIYDDGDNDSRGQIVPFSDGKTVVTLHFRKRL